MTINTKGFTLIELLISISILSIISLLLLPNYGNFNKKNTLRQAALNLGNDVELVKNKALSGVYTNGSNCPSDNCKVDWGIKFNCSANTYTLGPYELGTSTQYNDSNYVSSSDVKTISLPSKVSFDSATCPDNWVFGRLNGLVTYPSSGGNNQVKLSIEGISDSVTLTLDLTSASLTYESN